VKGYRGTYLYEKALRKRRVWVEPLFAEAKDWHGMRRFRLRRLEKVNIEALLIASGQNVKRLLSFGERRPKKLAQAAALRPPVAIGHEISRAREHRWSRSWRPTRSFFNRLASLVMRYLAQDLFGLWLRRARVRVPSVTLVGSSNCRNEEKPRRPNRGFGSNRVLPHVHRKD
jgi:hypothetical protein